MKTKTRFHKLTAWLLTLAMLMTFIPNFTLTASAATYTGTTGECTWTFDDSTGVLTISGEGAMEDYASTSAAPWYTYKDSIKEVKIEEGVTSIATYAFYQYPSLATVNIAGSVTSFGKGAFQNCSSLQNFRYWGKTEPSSDDGNYAFTGTRIWFVHVPTDYQGDSSFLGKSFNNDLVPAVISYTVTVVNGTGGGEFTEGEDVLIMADEIEGKQFVCWTSEDGVEFYKYNYPNTRFTMPAKNVTVTATYEDISTYSVTIDSSIENGTVEADVSEAAEGDTVTLTVTPDNGYKLKSLTVGGADVTNQVLDGKYTFTMPGGDVTVSAEFEPIPTASLSVKLNIDGDVSDDRQFSFRVLLDDTLINGTYGDMTFDYGDAYVYLKAGETVTAEGLPVNVGYTVTTQNQNGFILTGRVDYEGILPEQGAVASFTFAPITYTITATATPAEGGTVTGDGTYRENAFVTVTATANDGYKFVNWTENGNEVSTNESHIFMATEDRNLVANFELIPHVHDWNILSNGNVITATCQSTFGDCPNPTSTVTLVAPENLVYDGNDKVVTTNGIIEGVTIPDVQYTGDRNNVGTFTASLTVDNVMATLSVTIEKAEVNNVSFDVTAPEALDEKQTTVTNGTGYTAAISWNTEAERFGFNAVYTATVTLTADGNHKFADTLSKDDWTVALNNDKTVATFTKTFEKTRMQKIESVNVLSNVNLDSHKSDADAVIATLPTTVSVALEENGTDELSIVWSCANFNSAPLCENTFTWTATNDKYDNNNFELSGTITVTNPAANAVAITVKTENTTLVYNAADIDLTSLFDIDTNAGNATYTVTNETGAGAQSGTALTVTKAGTFTVKVDTAANGIYAAGTQTATLTVNKANGTGTVSMEGWTYGETAKAPAISANKGEATYQYKARGADDSTYSSDKPSNAGEYTIKATFAETDLYNEAFATADFAIAKKDIAGATVGAFEQITYTGIAQTPSATVTIGNLTVTGNWSNVTNVADTTTFTANGNFTGTITDKETGMAKANSSVTTTPNANTITYNEAAQELVTVGTANGGTLKYSLNNATWVETIPTGTNADAYEVWYKVFGDANHNDTDAVKVDVTIAKKSIEAATVALDGALTYTGAEQTQNVTVTLDGFTVTFDVADNKATNVKTDGNYTLKVTANGNFEGEKTLEWNIAKADHIIEGENIPTASRIRRGNKLSTSTITPAELKDAEENVLGTFAWVTPDDEMTETGDFVKQVKFTPTDTNNYNEKIFDVTVNVYRPSSGGGSSSNTTTTTTKNEDGSTTKVTENKATGTKTEVTTNPDGSTSTVETKKDGTVTTTEKDKDGNTTTTVEKPDGTSTTTEKNKDGSEKVTEEKADGTTVTTEKDTDGTKTVTTENADGTTTTEETKKDGTKVTTETNADAKLQQRLKPRAKPKLLSLLTMQKK